ncbi:MAG: adenosylcobinamide-GDP ribazoletransferase [Candidatus Melainabacteria bacterium]|jgi:adenosylcobinamide-GDP ribazoletransferase|nr:adenosylcobinamide-GDP ribazoletransferase [Candidatus Melainabacteria bacterium]
MEFDIIRGFRLATSFLTILPICPKDKIKNEEFARSIIYFSLAGLVLGLFNLCFLYFAQYASSLSFNIDQFIFQINKLMPWFIDWGLALAPESLTLKFNLMNPWFIAIVLVLINTCVTGGLHLDGLMDSFDGIACGKTSRKDILVVMKDSCVGAFGSMAGSIALIVQVVALAQLDYANNFNQIALLVLLLPTMSRFMMVLAILFQVETKPTGSLAMFKKYQKTAIDIIVNLVWIKLAAIVYISQVAISLDKLIQLDLIIIPWMIASWFVYKWLGFKLKGHNGDSMGAGLVINESLFLLMLAVL